MVRAIAKARGLPEENVLPGAGSSDLIFLAFRHWLRSSSRVLILDPMYGEYAYILEQVIGCRVDRFLLSRSDGYEAHIGELKKRHHHPSELVVLVNPNSPTGKHIPRGLMEQLLAKTPSRMWVDETYIEYAGESESIKQFAAQTSNVVVCKSMSKVYALSGLRAAYLAGSGALIESLRRITPPWAVSLPAQVAAVAALQDLGYYASCYAETHALRAELSRRLADDFGFEVIPGVANFLLCHLPDNGPTAAATIAECRKERLFLRDAAQMGERLGKHALRIAVKNQPTNERMLAILGQFHKSRRRPAQSVMQPPCTARILPFRLRRRR